MTSIYFGEEHESFRRTVRQFLESEIAPYAREWEEARRIPREAFRRMGDLGFLGILVLTAVALATAAWPISQRPAPG